LFVSLPLLCHRDHIDLSINNIHMSLMDIRSLHWTDK